MQVVTIKISNWEKFNPRNDRVNHVWFRFQNDLLHNQKMFGLSDSQLVLFVHCLCEGSKKNSDEVEINLDYLSALRKRSVEKLIEDFHALERRGVIVTVESRHEAGLEPALGLATLHTNNTNKQTNNNAQSRDFADFYSGYPRKIGRSKAEQTYRSAIKNGAKPEDIIFARDAYRKHCLDNKIESKFIKHASTFMNQWTDWLAPDAGHSESFAAASGDDKYKGLLNAHE